VLCSVVPCRGFGLCSLYSSLTIADYSVNTLQCQYIISCSIMLGLVLILVLLILVTGPAM